MTSICMLIIIVALQYSVNGAKALPHFIDEFPMGEFYNISDVSMYDNTSYNHWRCYRQRSHVTTPPCCDCDDDCWKYRTCCIDILWGKRKPMNLNEYLEEYYRVVRTYKSTTCDSILPTSPTNHHDIETLYKISSCPPKSSKQDVELCRDALQMGAVGLVPVLGIDTYLYKNKYCAKCNGINSFKHQDLEVKCVDRLNIRNDTFSLNDLYNQRKCIISIKRTSSNDKYLKTCQHQIFSGNCSERDKKLCHIYQGTIADGHKNYFCFKCSSKCNITNTQWQCPTTEYKDLSKYTYRFNILPEGKKFRIANCHQTFPIWDFLQLPSSFTLSKNEGFDQYLCSGKRKKCCSCSRDCMINKACCVDIFWNETNPVNIETYKNILISERKKGKDHACLPVYSPALGTQYTVNYRKLVRSCERNANSRDKNSCLNPSGSESPSMVVPVLGSDGFTYANSFCAKCNFVSYTYINFTLKCEYNKLLMDSSNTTISSRDFNIDKHFSKCELDIIDATYQINSFSSDTNTSVPLCSYNDPYNYHLCKSYYGVVGNYPNFHCRSCATNKPLTKLDIKYCDSKPKYFMGNTCGTKIRPLVIDFRWSLILSFSDDTGNLKYDDLVHGSLTSNCGNGQYFEIKQGKCIDIYCPPMYVVSGLNCVPAETFNKKQSKDLLSNLGKKRLANYDYFVYLQLHNETFNQTLFKILTYRLFYDTNNSTIFQSTEPVKFSRFDAKITDLQLQLLSYHVDYFIGMNIQKSLLTPDYGLDFSRFFHGNRLCANPLIIPYQMIKGDNSTTVTYQNQTFDVAGLSYWISFQAKKLIHHYSACDQFHLMKPCPRQLLLAFEINKSENMTITHYNTNDVPAVYKVDQYLPTDKGYFVCLNKANLLRKQTRLVNYELKILLDAEYYITITGISISIVCYVCIILTYIIFKDSYTVAGLSNCFMCLSLLIADAMALSSMKAGENTVACLVVAVIIHWSLLAAFSWTLVIAFDLVSRFGSLKLPGKENVKKKMIHRSLIGFFLPAVVVFVAVALDKTSTTEIGYGESQICWRVNNLYARIALYIVPTALVTLIALTSLCFTIRKISKEKKSTGKYLDSKENTKVTLIKMAIKLCIILGLTEIFGYIQIPNDKQRDFNLAFGFIYAVLRSFRGVMLWFVYIYGRSGKNLYKDRFQKSVSNLSRKGSIWSTVSTRVPLTVSANMTTSLQSNIQRIPLQEM